MTAQVLQFVELSDADRKETGRLGTLAKGDHIEVHIKRHSGGDQTVSLPPEAAALIEALLGHLSQGERVAVLTFSASRAPWWSTAWTSATCPFATSANIAARR
jgi:hypothetical protein